METDRGIYLSMAELVRRYRTPGASTAGDALTAFELRCFSQHGEDGVIAEILSRIGTLGRFFVEFGVEGGREGNCVFLADLLGWAGLFLESDDGKYSELHNKYRANRLVVTRKAIVTPETVEGLFSESGVPPEPDVLSIDVDGGDYWIWQALEAYRPRVVVIEYNAALPAGRQLVQPRGFREPWDGTDYFGASLDALCALAEVMRYRLVHTDLAAANAFFVRTDLDTAALPRPDEVPRRHQPNYFMQAYRHPVDPRCRRYIDLAHSGTRQTGPDDGVQSGALRPRESPPHELAAKFATRTDFIWHQRFELTPGVYTPGVSDIDFLLDAAGVPERLDDATVLDIGTTNGGAAFECERRGARRVVAVDIVDADWFGFAAIKEFLGSQVEHVRGSIYALPELLNEQFDVVLFWGVLYHLRHPLLALDNVRRLAQGVVSVETVVSDHLLPEDGDVPTARFFRSDEFAGDGTIWFAPNLAALRDWCLSCGLSPTRVRSWPASLAARAMLVASVAEPEWPRLSYEQALSCSALP